MADQKSSAPAASHRKAELADEQLKDVSGGAIYMDRAEPIYMNKAAPQVQPVTSVNPVAKP